MKRSTPCHIGIVVIVIFSLVSHLVASRLYGACASLEPNRRVSPSACASVEFPCLEGGCITREFYCDREDDCEDQSDEMYCDESSYEYDYEPEDPVCPETFTKCLGSRKCIPNTWACDGTSDCPSGDDEAGCSKAEKRSLLLPENVTTSVNRKALQRMNERIYPSSATYRWGPLVHKLAVALYLADPNFVSMGLHYPSRQEMTYELSIQFLLQISRIGIKNIPSSYLASFVNAFLVTCLDPRNFYGYDLVQELKVRVKQQEYVNPYVMIALCNAGESISSQDVDKLNDTFWSNNLEIWTGTQALVVMALSCARDQPNSNVSSEIIQKLTSELKQHQYQNGTVENLHTTALVMQALYAAETSEDPSVFDEIKAVKRIIQSQQPDGFFGSSIMTYYALPVINCRSIVHISTSHCPTMHKDEDVMLHDLVNWPGEKIRVQYSLWIGMQKDLERTLTMRVPANTSIYEVMEMAARFDDRYKFEYVVKDGKPYVTALSGVLDDAESGKFWFLYVFEGEEFSLLNKSTADVVAKDNDHIVMWYRKGTWIE